MVAKPSPLSSRIASIDALRIAGAAAGLVGHAAVPYTTQPIHLVWPVRDTATTPIADVIVCWTRAAQVQIFFLIAGLVAVHVYAAYDVRTFVRTRLIRLGVPFLAGVAFVLPVLAAVWAAGWIESGRATWSEVWAWRFADAELDRNRVGPAHLWFLQDLLLISILASLAWHRLLRPIVARLAESRLVLPALAATGVSLVWAFPEIVFRVHNTFIPDAARLAYGATFVAGGAWLAHDRGRTSHGLAVPLVMLLTGGAAAAALATYLHTLDSGPMLVPAVLVVGSGWLTVLGCASLASRLQAFPSERWARVGGAVLAAYIVHAPVVGLLHILVFGRLPALPALMLVIAGGALLTALVVACGRRLQTAIDTLRVPALLSPSGAAFAAVAVGIGLRVFHYVRNPDVWHDEAALLVNVIERDYTGLLGPLTYHEAAPPLFLWLERWMALSFSDSTWTMRLVPLLASLAAMVVLWPLARGARVAMAPAALILAATSSQLLGHSVEAKPYAVDVLVATLAAWAFVASRHRSIAARVGMAIIAAPFVIWLSYPGIFVMGGIVMACAIVNWHERCRAGWLLIGALAVTCLVSLAALVAGPVHGQRSVAILGDWAWAFPSAWDPWTLTVWFVRSLIGLTDYCFRPFGGLLLVPIVAGVLALWRRREAELVALFVGPIALAALAGLVGQYPFSGSRVMVFALPALALLAAEGLSQLVAHVAALPRLAYATLLALAMVPPSVLAARDLVSPWSRPETRAAAEVVLASRQPDEIVASGNWESRYYFRSLGSKYVPLDERPLPAGERRLWCVVHGPSPEIRRQKLAAAASGVYQIVSSVDLEGVSVIELERRSD